MKKKLMLPEGVLPVEQAPDGVDVPVEGTKPVVGNEAPVAPAVPSGKKELLPEDATKGLPKVPRHPLAVKGTVPEPGKKVDKKDSQKFPVAVALSDRKIETPHVQHPVIQIAQAEGQGKEMSPAAKPSPSMNAPTVPQTQIVPDAKIQQPTPVVVGTAQGQVPDESRGAPALVQPGRSVADRGGAIGTSISRTELARAPTMSGVEKRDKVSGGEVDSSKSEVEAGPFAGAVGVAAHHAEAPKQEGGVAILGGEHIAPVAAVQHEKGFAPEAVQRAGSAGLGDAHAITGDVGHEGGRGRAPELIAATPTSLEVGMANGAHGWLKVRAELEDGVVTASLSATTESGREALHRELPSMSAYLQDEKVGVGSLVVKEAPPADTRQSFDGSGTQGQGQTQRQDSERQESGAAPRTGDGVWEPAGDERVHEVPNGLGGSTGLLTPTVGLNGSWLNVRV
ncbi:hypothetical protein [Granulicella sp. dw_53]|uniref:hypothetical protein n=1 Tax=Granulicella sp. dw_53 TaxID=2719792 RepID=UPI001BD60855|nr:hypothetical protein [Granulicella sp. dw_53]